MADKGIRRRVIDFFLDNQDTPITTEVLSKKLDLKPTQTSQALADLARNNIGIVRVMAGVYKYTRETEEQTASDSSMTFEILKKNEEGTSLIGMHDGEVYKINWLG